MEINELVTNKQQFNLAGIIPVAGQSLDYNFPWHDSLAPIGQNYLAVEKAVSITWHAMGCGLIVLWLAVTRYGLCAPRICNLSFVTDWEITF